MKQKVRPALALLLHCAQAVECGFGGVLLIERGREGNRSSERSTSAFASFARESCLRLLSMGVEWRGPRYVWALRGGGYGENVVYCGGAARFCFSKSRSLLSSRAVSEAGRTATILSACFSSSDIPKTIYSSSSAL